MLFASDVKLADSLKNPLSGIAQKRQSSLADSLSRLKGISSRSATASGRGQGSYTPFALGQANTLASRGIDDTLYGLLGNTSYANAKAVRDHATQMEIARQIGEAMSPSLAQQIMGGLGSAANLGFTGLGIYKGMKNGAYTPSATPAYGVASNPYGYNLASMQGYSPYDYQTNWRGY